MIQSRAKGCYIYDGRGKKYIDFTSGGIFAAIFGAGSNPFLSFVLQPIACCYGQNNKITEYYKDMLKEFTGFESVALFSTGSEATEAFWRCMRVYSGKPGIWGGLIDPDEVGKSQPNPPYDAMHGWTMGSLVMAGKMNLPTPGMFSSLAGDFSRPHELTCGMIMEPYHAPSAQFHKERPTMDRIRANQKEFPNIPLCVDEVQGGFGRTGKLFAHQWYQKFKPDFVTVGKAMGAGFPLSALLGPKEIMDSKVVREKAHLRSTHSGHPVMCNIGIEVINRIRSNNLIEKSRVLGAELERQLLLELPKIRHHSGHGLLAGLEFKNAEQASKVVMECQKRGLLVVDTGRKWVKIGPPFIITEKILEEGCKILTEVVGEVVNASKED